MNEFQTLLHDTVTRLFTDLVTQPLLEQTEEGAWPTALWDAIEECGLTRPHLPEAYGGADGSWLDAHIILYATGLHATPAPLAETMLASWLLAQAGIEIPDGPLTVFPEPVDPAALSATTLQEWSARLPWGRNATHAVFCVGAADEPRIGLVALGDATITHGENLAREPRDWVVFDHAPLVALDRAPLAADAVTLYGAMVRSAQMAGALASLLAQSVRYVGERQQFGRPIGSFQAVQQELAKLAGQVAVSDIAAKAAFRAADRAVVDPDLSPRFEIAAAKVILGDAVDPGTSIAHQAHGAIGFTYEHTLHFASRRLWSWRAEFGSAAYWAAQLGHDAVARGADALWPYVTAR